MFNDHRAELFTAQPAIFSYVSVKKGPLFLPFHGRIKLTWSHLIFSEIFSEMSNGHCAERFTAQLAIFSYVSVKKGPLLSQPFQGRKKLTWPLSLTFHDGTFHGSTFVSVADDDSSPFETCFYNILVQWIIVRKMG